MAKKVYALRNVPDDEVDEMRALLREHDIDFHETDAGFFGIGTAAIWVKQAEQFDQAKTLIADYQQQRFERARGEYEELKAQGRQPRLLDAFRARPGKMLVYLFFALLLLSLMTGPYWL